jgi:non-homologous end joining protein Ku
LSEKRGTKTSALPVVHIVEQKSGHFDPDKFEDHCEAALQESLAKNQKGCRSRRREERTGHVVIVARPHQG